MPARAPTASSTPVASCSRGSLGLGAIPRAALATYSPFVRDFFAIPEDRSVLLGFSFGRPDRDHPASSYRTRRASLTETVRWATD